MNDLDRRIDALYQLPLGEFTASRNAFAKALTGEPAKQVRALKKPTVVPLGRQSIVRAGAADSTTACSKRVRPCARRKLAASEGPERVEKVEIGKAQRRLRRHRSRTAARSSKPCIARRSPPPTAGAEPDAETRSAQTFEALSIAPSHPSTPGRLSRRPFGRRDLKPSRGSQSPILRPRQAARSKRETASSPSGPGRRAEEERKAEERRQAEARVQDARSRSRTCPRRGVGGEKGYRIARQLRCGSPRRRSPPLSRAA